MDHSQHDSPTLVGRPELYAFPLDDLHGNNADKHHKTILNKVFNWVGATSVLLALTPAALRSLGVGAQHDQWARGSCCPIIAGRAMNTPLEFTNLYQNMNGETSPVYGIAGGLSGLFSRIPEQKALFELEKKLVDAIPFTGGNASHYLDPTVPPLARGGIPNVLVAGGLVLIGHFGGHVIEGMGREHAAKQATLAGATPEEIEHVKEKAGVGGRIFKNITQLMGLTFLLPMIAPQIGHVAVLVSATVKDMPLGTTKTVGDYVPFLDTMDYENHTGTGIGTTIAAVMGKNPGACKFESGKALDALQGAGGLMASQLCCAVPALMGMLPMLLTHANHRRAELPEGIRPYNAKHYVGMPDVTALAKLPDAEIAQVIADTTYHIADTKAAEERTEGIRTAMKIGASVAATVGVVIVGTKLLKGNNAALQEFETAADAVKNAIATPASDYNFTHVIPTTLPEHLQEFGRGRVNIGLPTDFIKHTTDALEGVGQHAPKPDKIILQIAGCLGKITNELCGCFETCCVKNGTYLHESLFTGLNDKAQMLVGGSDVERNRAFMISGASVALGSLVYKGMEKTMDTPAAEKIHGLKHKKLATESISAARAASSFEDRVTYNQLQPALMAR